LPGTRVTLLLSFVTPFEFNPSILSCFSRVDSEISETDREPGGDVLGETEARGVLAFGCLMFA
jgi:hypothetical protein